MKIKFYLKLIIKINYLKIFDFFILIIDLFLNLNKKN
jgi:hypothetical protein